MSLRKLARVRKLTKVTLYFAEPLHLGKGELLADTRAVQARSRIMESLEIILAVEKEYWVGKKVG